jgi:hypothetical protein
VGHPCDFFLEYICGNSLISEEQRQWKWFFMSFLKLKTFYLLWPTGLYLQPTVDIKTVLSQLMDRLSNYAASSSEVSLVHLCHKLSSQLFIDTFMSQVLPEFLQVEAFTKLSTAISRVSCTFSSLKLLLKLVVWELKKSISWYNFRLWQNKCGDFVQCFFFLHESWLMFLLQFLKS